MARDEKGRFVSKSDGGGDSAPPPKKRKIPDATSQEEFDTAYNPPREGYTEEEAVTMLDEVLPEGAEGFEDGVSLEGYRPEEFEGDPDALREAMQRLREEGSVEAASEALEEMDLDALENPPDADDGDSGEAGEAIPWSALAERLGMDAESVTVTAKVDGEEVEVPLSEAVNGYQRQEVFTRKTQQLAERRKELESALEGSAARLQALDAIFGQALNPQQRQQVGQAYQRVLAERAALEAHHLETEVLPRQHAALADALGWESEDDVQAGKERLAEAAISQGFDPDDLSNVVDHRLLVLLDKAQRYDEMQARSEDARKEARSKRRKGRNLKPGVGGSQKRKPAKLSEARKRLRHTGSVDAAVEALSGILPSNEELGI